MEDKVKNKMAEFIDIAYEKGYSKEATRIIGTIVLSETAVGLGYDEIKGLDCAIEHANKYDNERDCINALIEIIK